MGKRNYTTVIKESFEMSLNVRIMQNKKQSKFPVTVPEIRLRSNLTALRSLPSCNEGLSAATSRRQGRRAVWRRARSHSHVFSRISGE